MIQLLKLSIITFTLSLIIAPVKVFCQYVDLPTMPDFIYWYEDHERMKKGKVKAVHSYSNYNGIKTLDESFEFDTMGYVIKKVGMRDGKISSWDSTQWIPGHHSSQLFGLHNNKPYCYRKENYDSDGYTTETSFRHPNDSFELQGTFVYEYNPDGTVSHEMRNYFGSPSEHRYEYDASGKMITAKEFGEEDYEMTWEYTCNSVGKLIKEYWWQKEGGDTSSIKISYWTWNTDGTIQKEVITGRDWKKFNYEWKGDILKIDCSQDPAYFLNYKYEIQLSTDKKLMTNMVKYDKEDGKKHSEFTYEYLFYE